MQKFKVDSSKSYLTTLRALDSYQYVCVFVYCCFFVSLFYSNDYHTPANLFCWVVGPVILLPNIFDFVFFLQSQWVGKKSFYSVREAISRQIPKSSIINASIIFLLTLSVSSWLYPYPTSPWAWFFIEHALEIIVFLIAIVRLIAHFPLFITKFFEFMCLIVGVQCIINIVIYLSGIQDFESLARLRFGSTFGYVPDHYPTTGSLVYGLFFVAGVNLLFEDIPRWRKLSLIAAICALCLALILSQSRGSLIAAFASLAIWGLSASIFIRNCMITFGVGVIAMFLLIPKIGAYALTRGDRFRFWVWEKFISLAAQRPILGYGQRLEFWVYLPNDEHVGHAHNLLLSSFIRGGILSLISLGYVLIKSLLVNYRYFKSGHSPIPYCWCLMIIISGLVDYDLLVFLPDWQWVAFWLPIGLSAGVEILKKDQV